MPKSKPSKGKYLKQLETKYFGKPGTSQRKEYEKQIVTDIKLKIIENEKELKVFLSLFRKLSDKEHKTKDEIEELKLIALLINHYENSIYTVEAANPIVLIKMAMDFKGLEPKDLIDKIGTKAHVYNVLNKRKALSKENIIILSDLLNIPIAQLMTPYKLK